MKELENYAGEFEGEIIDNSTDREYTLALRELYGLKYKASHPEFSGSNMDAYFVSIGLNPPSSGKPEETGTIRISGKKKIIPIKSKLSMRLADIGAGFLGLLGIELHLPGQHDQEKHGNDKKDPERYMPDGRYIPKPVREHRRAKREQKIVEYKSFEDLARGVKDPEFGYAYWLDKNNVLVTDSYTQFHTSIAARMILEGDERIDATDAEIDIAQWVVDSGTQEELPVEAAALRSGLIKVRWMNIGTSGSSVNIAVNEINQSSMKDIVRKIERGLIPEDSFSYYDISDLNGVKMHVPYKLLMEGKRLVFDKSDMKFATWLSMPDLELALRLAVFAELHGGEVHKNGTTQEVHGGVGNGRKALKFYRGASYSSMNEILRGQAKADDYPSFVSEHIEELSSLIENSKIPDSGFVYRGFSLTDAEIEGVKKTGEYVDNGFLSTTEIKKLAEGKAYDIGDRLGVIAKINYPRGAKAIKVVDDFGDFSGEKEIIFQRGTLLTVKNIDVSQSPIYIEFDVEEPKDLEF